MKNLRVSIMIDQYIEYDISSSVGKMMPRNTAKYLSLSLSNPASRRSAHLNHQCKTLHVRNLGMDK